MAVLASTRVGGGSQPTVLLHGFLGSSRNLRGFAQRWAERAPDRTFLLLDLTGHGASTPLPAGADLATLARDVAETVAAAGIGAPPSVLGHSLGGRVGLAWARLQPGALADLTLLDIGPGPIPKARSSSARVLDVLLTTPAEAADRRSFRKLLVDGGLAPATADWVLMNVDCDAAGCRWRIDRQALAALNERVGREDLWPVIETADFPILCIRGARSTYVDDAEAARLEAAGVPVTTVDAAHDLHIEAPEAVLDLLAG